MSNDNSKDGIKKKRIKVSFTCKECRLKRTKCDKKSPCLACKNRNSICEYGAERQIKPRRPNKDSLILRLSNQVDYYKKMCKQFVPNTEFRDFNSDLMNIDYALGSRTLHKHNTFITNDKQSSNDLIINYKCDDTSTTILSIKYCLKNDKVFNKIFLNIKNENHQTSTANLSSIHYKKLSKYQKIQFEKFSNLLIRDIHHVNDPSQQRMIDKAFKFFHYDYHDEDLNIVEDEVVDEPSKLLSNLLEDIQRFLPSYSDLNYLMSIYMNNFQSEAPLANLDVIKTFINENISTGDNDECVIKPLKVNIRNNLCLYAITFIICGISNVSLKLKTFVNNDDTFSFSNDIDTTKLAIMSMQLIKCSKVYLEPNITKLTAFMYIWLNFCYLPIPNSFTSINDSLPTRILTNILLVLCDNINLYPLNLDNPHIGLSDDKNITLRNYFMLRISLVFSLDDIFNQKCTSFKFDEIQKQRLLEYSYKNNPLTTNSSITQSFSNIYNLYLVKLIMLYHIQDCYSLIARLSRTINLTQFEKRLNFMLEYYNRELSLNYMKTPNTKSIIFETYTPNIKIDQNVAINKILLEINLIKSISELKMYSFLIMVLESTQPAKFREYLVRMVNKIVDTLIMLNDFSMGNYQKYLGDLESILMNKNCEELFDQLFLCISQVLSRMIMNSEKNIIDIMFKMLKKTLSLYTKKYRFINYRSFQLGLFVEDMLIRYENGEYYFEEMNDEDLMDIDKLNDILTQEKLRDILKSDEFELDKDYINNFKGSINICESFIKEFM